MIQSELFMKFIVSLLLGALIGLQRERFHKGGMRNSQRIFGGIRTFILISFAGTLAMFLSENVNYIYGVIITIAFLYFMIIVYSKRAEITQDMGGVTEVTAIVTYIIGMICYLGEGIYGQTTQLAVALTIIVLMIISMKHITHKFAHTVDYKELITTIKFAVIAFVILPILPNTAYGPFEIFNPYKTWLVIVLVSGISYVGYILNKFLSARKSVTVAGILGGLASSTALTSAMSIDSKKNPNLSKTFAAATVTANAIMFLRMLVIVAFINMNLVEMLLLPMLVMAAVGFAAAAYLFKADTGEKSIQQDVHYDSPFQIMPALKFGAFYIIVLFIVKIASLYLSNSGLIAAGFVAGFSDVDAITLSMAALAKADVLHSIVPVVAVIAITLASMTNMISKFVIAHLFGSRKYAKYIGLSFLLIFLAGLGTLAFFYF